MRKILFKRIVLIALGGLAGALTLSWTVGQTPPPRNLPPELQSPPTTLPPSDFRPVTAAATPTAMAPQPVRRAPVAYDRFRNKLDTLDEQTRQMVMSGLKGMEWLNRFNQPNGLFLHGYLPAVNLTLDADDDLHQAMAAFVLARSARFTGDEGYSVHANHSILTLLSHCTTVDPAAPTIRHPVQPSIVCNRLALAGFLVMSIHELPEPAPDLLIRAEELCAFIRQQQRDDGSLSYVDSPGDNPLVVDPEGINKYPGPALYAIVLSSRAKPAPWKSEAQRKAVAYYRKWFKDHPQPDFVPWMTAACTEGYLVSNDRQFAEFAFEMNDWLCGLQYVDSASPRQLQWRGGFKKVSKGRIDTSAPGIESALYSQSLADCCGLIRHMQPPDVQRYDRYRAALVSSLNFLSTLQFTEANTLHISANYRDFMVGGFHPTQIDGNLRIDQSAAAVSAFIQFFVSGADKAQ